MPTISSKIMYLGALLGAVALAAPSKPARAQGTPEQQQACAPDAVRLCASTIPDVAKTTACMKAHVAELSPRCRVVFDEATGGGAPKTATAAPKAPPHEAAQQAEKTPRAAARDNRAGAPRTPTREATRETDVRENAARETAERVRADRKLAARENDAREPRRAARAAAALPSPRAPVADERDPQVPDLAPAAPPPFRSRVPGLDDVAAQIADNCRAGLIDAFTCRNTFDALRLTQ